MSRLRCAPVRPPELRPVLVNAAKHICQQVTLGYRAEPCAGCLRDAAHSWTTVYRNLPPEAYGMAPHELCVAMEMAALDG